MRRRLAVGISGSSGPFSNRPQRVDELIDHTVARVLDQFGIHLDLIRRREGI